MSWDSASSWPVRGKLARHLGRLQQHLDSVGEQVREAVANAVGRTVAEAVGEAVYDTLAPYADPSAPESRYYHRATDRSVRTRQDWDDPAWRRPGDSSPWRDPYADDNYDEPRYDDGAEAEDRSSLRDAPQARRWRRAMAAGLQAAAWWLQRHPGQLSLLVALAVGSVAGLAVLAGPVSGVATLVMSALGLAYLLDLVRLSSALLG
ncbi:MAG TPA: hypothetical protein VH592_12690 [Gemmataceae bacterium]|jgi:hypothetical protein